VLFNAQLPSVPVWKLEVIHRIDNLRDFLRSVEVSKRFSPEDSMVVVVVECVRDRQAQIRHYLHQLFFLKGERDVLDGNGASGKITLQTIRSAEPLRESSGALERYFSARMWLVELDACIDSDV
jgi:hypothetical protein